jgi:hypothetical protein
MFATNDAGISRTAQMATCSTLFVMPCSTRSTAKAIIATETGVWQTKLINGSS